LRKLFKIFTRKRTIKRGEIQKMKTDTLLEKYRNELTKKSIMFYNNNGITNHKKVKQHKEFLKDILGRLEDDKYNMFDSNGYNELHNIIEKAWKGIKVQKNNFLRNIAVNLYGRVQGKV
jgi:hypothetical protein